MKANEKSKNAKIIGTVKHVCKYLLDDKKFRTLIIPLYKGGNVQ